MPDADTQPEWAKRIEAKLDRLIAALADEDEEPEAFDLEGNRMPGERNPFEPL